MKNITGNTFKAIINWLMDQEDTCDYYKPNFPDHIHYVLTRLHLQDPTTKWKINGDEYNVLRTLIYSIHRANIFDNIMKVLCESPELEDRMLAIILRSSSPEFRKIGEKIVNYLSEVQKVNMSTRLITAIRNAE